MSPLTRRRALHGAVGLLSVLAGCSDDRSTSSEGPNEQFGTVQTDPEALTLWSESLDPIVRESDEPTTEADRRLRDVWVVATADSAADLRIAEVDRAAEARAFLERTDYGSETVYVEQFPVGECFTPELCNVRWSDGRVETDYARRYRDADASCEVGAESAFAALVRIPDALDPEAITQHGSSYGSGSCAMRNERASGGDAGGDSTANSTDGSSGGGE